MSLFSAGSPLVFLDINLALEQIGDVDAMQGMLSMLEESLTRDMPVISQLLTDGDTHSANRVLHSLKGFLPIFCVESICNDVARVEALSKTATAQEVTRAYSTLLPDLESLQSEVEDYLNGANFAG